MATEDHQVSRPSAAPPASSQRFWRRWRWLALSALLVIIVLLVVWWLRRGAPRAPPPAAAAIAVGQSRTGDINEYIYALGTVTPVNTITVYSQVTGRIVTVHYTEGQMVHTGQALIDIDPRPYESMLTQAQGTLQHDQGLLTEARLDLQRYQAAYARNGISRQQLEDQEQTVQQYEGSLKSDQGTVDYDRVQLSYCHIVAAIGGRVGLRLVDPGNTVFAGSASALVVITQLQPITVVFDVSEDQLPQVQAQLHGNQMLPVDAFDRSNAHQLASGSLTALDNQVDTTTGTVRFRARFPNQDMALFPNQFVNARLLLQTLHQVTLVPTAAIQYNGTSTFVYVVRTNDTVAVQNLTVLTSNDQDTAVQGLQAGVLVAASGFERIENGARVSYTAPGAPAAPVAPGPNVPANAR